MSKVNTKEAKSKQSMKPELLKTLNMNSILSWSADIIYRDL